MRSTTFTDRIGTAPALALACLGMAAAASAASAAEDEVPLGCYVRSYDAAHLARNPGQIVSELRLRLYPSRRGDPWADLMARFADQGRVKGTASAGQEMDQFLICWAVNGLRGCAAECDGGWFDIVDETADTLTLQVQFLMVGGEECAGAEDLAEQPETPVTYRLNKVAPELCEETR